MMKVNNKLKIKEFSLLCGVTVKTLRHYEKIGLLQPFEVDEWTGYRYYNVSQMQAMENIRRLKEMGFSLDEIIEMFASGSLKPTLQTLEKKIAESERELHKLQERCTMLRNLVDSQNKILKMEQISIQSLPEIIVASHRETINSYNDLGCLCCEVIGPEMARLGCKCPEPGYCFTIEHNEYRPTNIDIEYCEQVEEMGKDSEIIQFKKIPAVEKAICMKHYGPYERLYQSYVELFKYIEQQGYKVIGAPRANYIDGIWNQEDPEKWLTMIQVPVEKA
ncbi:MAG: MerR family transcriptional regulator [Bacteroidales bacterium]|nr:MerR family transcriptional regulator [Bacteroidales bacterium]